MNNDPSKTPGGSNEAPADAQQQQGQEAATQKVGTPQPSPAAAGMGSPPIVRGVSMPPMNQSPMQVLNYF